MRPAKLSLKLSLADQLRLEKAMGDMGKTADEVISILVREFFCREGVKNPRRKSRLTA